MTILRKEIIHRVRSSVSERSYALPEEREPNVWASFPRRVLHALALLETADRFHIHEAYADLIVREEESVSSLGDSRRLWKG